MSTQNRRGEARGGRRQDLDVAEEVLNPQVDQHPVRLRPRPDVPQHLLQINVPVDGGCPALRRGVDGPHQRDRRLRQPLAEERGHGGAPSRPQAVEEDVHEELGVDGRGGHALQRPQERLHALAGGQHLREGGGGYGDGDAKPFSSRPMVPHGLWVSGASVNS